MGTVKKRNTAQEVSRSIKASGKYIDADISTTAIIVCDVNDRVIYKNSAAFQLGMIRKDARIISFMDKSNREKYIKLKNGESSGEYIVLKTPKQKRFIGIVSNYRKYSLETIWIFPSALGVITEKENAERLCKCLSGISSLIEYRNSGERNRKTKLPLSEKLKHVGFACVSGFVPGTISLDMSVENISFIITRYVKKLFPEGIEVVLTEGHPINRFISDWQIFIGAYITMLSLIAAADCREIRINTLYEDDLTVYELFVKTDIADPEGSDSLSSFIGANTPKTAEALIFDYLCDTFGWKFSSSSFCLDESFNAVVRMKLKSSSKTRFSSDDCDEPRDLALARYAAFVKQLGY